MLIKKQKQSFTLIELGVVVAIIVLFTTLVIVYFDNVNRYSRDSKRKTDIDAIRKALLVQSNMGLKTYPVEDDWCCVGGVGADRCSNLEAALVNYISKIPKNPQYVEGSMASCYMFKSTVNSYELYTSLEEGGVIFYSQDTKALRDPKQMYSDCPNVSGEDEWISGPGFCVMKYEARRSDNLTCKDSAGNDYPCPVSKLSTNIWNNVSFAEAEAACKSIGAHLMSNGEWMALANDIEKTDANWIDGKGSGSLKRGNIGSGILKGGYNEANVDYGNTNNLAELKLSNGESIWHLSGNLSEWVDFKDSFTIDPAGSWVDYPAANIEGFGMLGYNNIGPTNTEYGFLKGVGKVKTASGGQYFLRGGNYQDTDNAGIYSLDLVSNPDLSSSIGFRCAK